jgi:hypothetical protein
MLVVTTLFAWLLLLTEDCAAMPEPVLVATHDARRVVRCSNPGG